MAPANARFSALLIIIVILGALQFPIAAANSVELDNPEQSVSGGRSILVEELTATWCPSCAEIDPYLMDYTNSQGSRIAMVAYHPSDGVDAFQPPAAQNRIERMQIVNPELGSTPTFVVEDGRLRIGPDSWQDVNLDIFDEEVKRQSYTGLKIDLQQNNATWTASASIIDGASIDYGQLTIMVVQHQKIVPEGFDNPGGKTRDKVLTGLAQCNLNNSIINTNIGLNSAQATNCNQDFSIQFTPENKFFSVLLIHEPTNSQLENGTTGTFGVVEYKSTLTLPTQSNFNNSFLLMGFILLGSALIFKIRRN